MKAYTDLEQSKKLAEILPLESADMRFCFSHTLGGRTIGHYPMIGREPSMGTIPCWSLAALLAVFPKIGANEPKLCKRYYVDAPIVRYVCTYGLLKETKEYCNPVDACYEIIVWLKENGKI